MDTQTKQQQNTGQTQQCPGGFGAVYPVQADADLHGVARQTDGLVGCSLLRHSLLQQCVILVAQVGLDLPGNDRAAFFQRSCAQTVSA